MASSATGDFVTEYPKEVKTFVWRIKDLSNILSLDFWSSPSASTCIEFDAGESIEMPSKWMVELFPVLNGNKMVLTLRLVCVENVKEGGAPPKSVTCEAALKNLNDPRSNWTTIILRPQVPTFLLKMDDLTQTSVGEELTIHLKFVMCASPVTVFQKRKYLYMTSRSMKMDVANDLGALLETGHNSDFVIKVKRSDTDEWVEMKVHKAILGSRSQYFERMLGSEMTESKTATLEIVDESPDCVKLILKWIYTGVLDEDWKIIPDEVVKAGDKYGLTGLIQFLDLNLHLACNFESAFNLREVAKLHGLVTATKTVTKFMAENLESILD